LTANDIQYRVRTGRLRPIYRGVYAVGHDAIPVRGRLCAALLLAGPGAALSHRIAAALHKLIPSMPPFIDVTVTGSPPRNQKDVVFHRAAHLELTRKHGLPVSTPLRTLHDLAATRPRQEVEKAINEALVLKLVTTDALIARTGPGAKVLRDIAGDASPTRSRLERRFLAALRRSAIPEPVKEHPVGRYVADFYWPAHRLVVETDGWGTHGHRLAFERDRVRDAELAIRDLVVIRVTERQVDEDLPATIGRLERWFSGPGLRRAS